MARMRRTTALAALGSLLSVAGGLALVGGATSADAATANPPSSFVGWGTDLAGTPGAYVSTPKLFGLGYPDASMTSDSDRTASVPQGLSTWWGAQTPPGKYWGSSHRKSFLSVRPASDTPGPASTTTISFPGADAPTGWGFVVGDVDSEVVTVTGVRADGQAASSEDLGFRGTFNACATPDKMDSCPTVAGKAPRWDVDLLTLTGSSEQADAIGADGWFVPTARLRSVTLSSTWTAGEPVFQTWVVTRTSNLSGTVSVSDGLCDLTQAAVTLVGAEGEVVKTVPVAEDGTWSFGQVAATNDFAARLTGVPPGCRASSPVTRDLSLALAPDRADFEVAQVVGSGAAAEGTVKDDENLPVKGAKVTLTVGSIRVTATTGDDGRFTLPGLPPNIAPTGQADSWYAVRLTPPGGLVQVGTLPDKVYVDAEDGVADTLDFIVEGTRLSAPSGPSTSLPTTVPTSTPTSTSSPTATASTTTSPVTAATSGATPYAAAAAYTSATTSPTTSSLASTGGPARVVLLAGLVLLVAGAATLVGSRRRRA